MKVEPISNGNLRVWLSQEELEEHTREGEAYTYLRQVLQTAQSRLRRLGKHILAELIPVAGGWVLLLSARRSQPAVGPTVYRIADVSTLYRLAERWVSLSASAPTSVRTCLYETDGGYDVAVYPTPRLDRRRAMLLKEFGTLIGRGEAAAACAAEHGCLLAAGDAFNALLLTAREPRLPTPSDREN